MSRLSVSLKALIDAPFARAGTTPAPPRIRDLYERIGRHAESKKVEQRTWLAFTAASTVTMNSPESLLQLHKLASPKGDTQQAVRNAELMREVGLKCIGLNGVPRTINCLNAFRAGLADEVVSGLSTTATRAPTLANLEASGRRGRALWDSIYRPFEDKLVDKLARSHPDLPVHIIDSEYAMLFTDPQRDAVPGQTVGRIATSAMVVACLRAQSGVGPQVTSHLFGLRKALDDGTWDDGLQNREGATWLASDEGSMWLLGSVDEIVDEIGHGEGSNFARGRPTKL